MVPRGFSGKDDAKKAWIHLRPATHRKYFVNFKMQHVWQRSPGTADTFTILSLKKALNHLYALCCMTTIHHTDKHVTIKRLFALINMSNNSEYNAADKYKSKLDLFLQ